MRALLAAACCLLASHVAAAELTDEQAHYLYLMAHAETHLRLPEQPPKIHTGVSIEMLQALVCPQERVCRPNAASVGGEVYLRDDLDFSQPRALLILLHEFVHVLQWHARGGNAKDCAEFEDRERQAYAVELRAAQKAGLETLSIAVAASSARCR